VESELTDKKIRLLDPTEAVLRYLPEVRAKSDAVVLLAHTGIETAQFLAKDLPVDAVIVGHFPAILEKPEQHGRAVVGMAGSKSDRFGTLELTLAPGGGVASFDGSAVRLLKDGPMVGEIHTLFEELETRQKEQRRERQLAAQRQRESQIRDEKARAIHERGGVFGAESCQSCHQPQYDAWRQTPHATAFATLAEADAWDDPECIGCHVTGAIDKQHVENVNLPPEVWNVQCEECHGLATEHARDGSFRTQGETTCVECHDAENSPDFEYELYRSYGVH
jgi:hypothetical protein